MTPLSPAQRTAGTARIVLVAGLLCSLEAVLRGSVARSLVGAAVLLAFAKRAD